VVPASYLTASPFTSKQIAERRWGADEAKGKHGREHQTPVLVIRMTDDSESEQVCSGRQDHQQAALAAPAGQSEQSQA
jgi:hypothetical protein